MQQSNKRSSESKSLICGILFILLCCSSVSTVIAKKADAPVITGVLICTLTPELAEDQRIPREQRGVVIMGVFRDSPAEKAGLHEGDIIVQVQNSKGKTVDIADDHQYEAAIEGIPFTKPLVLTILREGQRRTFQLALTTTDPTTINQPAPAAAPQTMIVDVAGSGKFRSIEGALLSARPGDTILVKTGNYKVITVLRNNITIAAFDPKNPPQLTGIAITKTSKVIIDGFNVAYDKTALNKGNSGKKNTIVYDQHGVTLNTSNQITVKNCQIKGFIQGWGVVVNGGTGIILDNNIITENWSGIFVNNQATDVKISQNLITKNLGLAGIFSEGGVTIIHNTILENHVNNEWFSQQLYYSKGRSVYGVGVNITNGQAALFNNIIAYNNVGCLIASTASQTVIENNDVFQHITDSTKMHAAYEDIQIKGGNANFLSPYIYESTPAPLFPLSASGQTTITPALKFQPSPTNISVNPLFVNPQQGDYHLAADSPLVGKGRGSSYIGAYPPLGVKDESGKNKPPVFGISARPLTDVDRQTLGSNLVNGLWVTEVKKESQAEKLQIKVDDIILEVNSQIFKNSEEFKQLVTTGAITTAKVFRSGKEIVLTVPSEF